MPASDVGAGRVDDAVVLLLDARPDKFGGCGKALGVDEVGGDEEGLGDGLVDDADMLIDLRLS